MQKWKVNKLTFLLLLPDNQYYNISPIDLKGNKLPFWGYFLRLFKSNLGVKWFNFWKKRHISLHKTLSEKSRLYFGLPMVREFELSFLGNDCLTGIIKIGRGQSIPFDCKVLPF